MNTLEEFEAGGSHYEEGLAIGSHFADAIHQFFDHYKLLQQHLLPFCNTSTGKNYYQSYLTLHRRRFPDYLAELGLSRHFLARSLLANQTDRDYPVYRDASLPDTDATLCSALFDLDKRELRIYWDDPVKKPENFVELKL